jgi:hypothetical protein
MACRSSIRPGGAARGLQRRLTFPVLIIIGFATRLAAAIDMIAVNQTFRP